jgi:hypothetical protein
MLTRKGEDGVLEITLDSSDFVNLGSSDGSVRSLLDGNRSVTIQRTQFCIDAPHVENIDGNLLIDFPIHYKRGGEVISLGSKVYKVVDASRRPTGESVRFSYSAEAS